METVLSEDKIRKVEEFSAANDIITYPWSNQVHKVILNELNSFKRYSYNSVKDLIRCIRNKLGHFLEVSEGVKAVTGPTREDFCRYFMERFPKLLCFLYGYSRKKHWDILPKKSA